MDVSKLKLKDWLYENLDNYELDDNIFLSLFSGWLEVEDEVLKKLCEAFVCRNKYLKIEILNKKDSEIDKFKSDIEREFKTVN